MSTKGISHLTASAGDAPECRPEAIRSPLVKCDRCKATVPEDDVEDCTVYVGGPEDRDSIHLCQKCFDEHEAEREVEARHWFAVYQAEQDATLWERSPEEYRRQMIDAGRGHLLEPQS